jgi:hypothetical protein
VTTTAWPATSARQRATWQSIMTVNGSQTIAMIAGRLSGTATSTIYERSLTAVQVDNT